MRTSLPLTCLIISMLLAGIARAQPEPRKQVEIHEPFKGKLPKTDDFKLIGADASNLVKPEPEGLRITLPAGKKRPPIGLASTFGASGDFEITVAYEILNEPKPADAGEGIGTRISLTLNLNRAGTNEISIRRKVTATRDVHILTWKRLTKDAGTAPEDQINMFPVKATTGRFRLRRIAGEVTYYLAEDADKEFTRLQSVVVGNDDVKDIQIFAATGSDTAALDVRFTDLHICAESLPRKLAAPKVDKAGESKIPDKEYAQTYVQPFKGNAFKPEGWNYASRLSEEAIQFENAGLHFTLLPGEEMMQSAGIVSAFGVKGDFEISFDFQILKDPDPADVGKGGTRLSLAITLDTPKAEVATLSRSMSSKGFITWMRNRDRPGDTSHTFPTPAMNGRLRLVRSGDELYYLASTDTEQPLLLLKKYRFGAEDLKRVVITTSTGGPKALLDLRVTDFRIRADAIPGAPITEVRAAAAPKLDAESPPPERSKIWLIAGAVVACLVLAVLVLAVILRLLGGRSSQTTDTASGVVQLACPNCGKSLKVKAQLAGKKVKCPKCGDAVLVPSAEARKT